MAAAIFAANNSEVTIDGQNIEGLQSIEYKVVKSRTDITQIGKSERVGVNYGQIVVTGSIKVKSTSPKLDELLKKPEEGKPASESKFQIVATFKNGETTKKVTLDECYLDDKTYSIDANGVGIATYTFSATRVREE